jgi:hypothetical protein
MTEDATPAGVMGAAIAALRGWVIGVAPIEGGLMVYPPGEDAPPVALQVCELGEEEAVLNVSTPLVRQPVTSAVISVSANIGLAGSLYGAGTYQMYEGVDSEPYLGAVVRATIPGPLWRSPHFANFLVAAVHSVLMHRDNFREFLNFAQIDGRPWGLEAFPDPTVGYPRPVAPPLAS